MSVQRLSADVAIVGYGPVGASAANFLGQEGLDVIVVERDASPYPRARAISTDEETIRCWQSAGLAEDLKAQMLGDRPIDFVDTRGRSFLSLKPKGFGNGHPPQMFLYQPALEQTIRRGVERFSNVTLLLEHEAGTVRQSSNGVELEVTDISGDVPKMISARYLIACDGGASPIRTQLKIGFEGKTYEDPWVVIDTKVKTEWPEVDRLRFHCDPSRPAVDCPTPLGHHRWEFPVLPGEDRDEVSSEDYVWKMLSRYGITDENVEILRRAVYVHHVRFAERWRQGRIFLAGDAAHCMPPWIGQGMASGVRDVYNLSWKLAAVVRDAAGPSLLDSYEAERKPHVRRITDAAVFFGRVITERNRALALARNVAFAITMRLPVAGPYLRDGGWAPMPDCVTGFVDRAGLQRHPIVGQRLPQPTSGGTLLDDVLGPCWSIISRTERTAEAWDGLASVHVVGHSLAIDDSTLDDFLGDADAVIVRPDKMVFSAVAAGQPLTPPPAELTGWGARVGVSTPAPQDPGERLLALAASRLGDGRLELSFGNPLVLRAILGQMAKSFDPRVANGFAGEIQYDLVRAGGRVTRWTLVVLGDTASARPGSSHEPKLVVRMPLADFLRVAAGELDQIDLLRERRVELSGDGLLGARMGPMFGRPGVSDIYVPPQTIDPASVNSDPVEA